MSKPLVTKASNVSDSTLQKHIRAISGLKIALDSAQGEYRAALKSAKSEGVRTSMLIAAFQSKKREIEDVEADLRDYVRYCALMNMPLVQMEMFAAPPNKGSQPADDDDDDPEAAEHRTWQAQEAGVKAGTEGKFQTENPHIDGSHEWEAWKAGWMKGQETLLPKSGVKKANPRKGRPPVDARMN